MRLLLHTLHLATEPSLLEPRASALVHWLAGRGHALSVVAATPGEGSAADTRPRRSESEAQLRVLRRPHLGAPGGSLGRTVQNVSFALASAPALLREAASFRPDLVGALAPSAAAASAALAAARVAGVPAWLHLEEDAPPLGIETAFACVSLAAGAAEARLEALGVGRAQRLALLPWTDTRAILPDHAPNPLRERLKLPADAIVVLQLGWCADPFAADALIAAAQAVPPKGALYFMVCGRGPEIARLAATARAAPRLVVLPWPPADGLAALLTLADIHLLPEGTAAADPLLPAKLGALLASGRPILSGTRRVPETLGLAVVPVELAGEALAAAAVRLAAAFAERMARGIAARCAAQDYFDQERVLRQLERGLQSLAPH